MELTYGVTSEPFENESGLINELHETLQSSYIDPTILIEREIQRCDTLYHLRDNHGAIVAFFMVGWHTLDIGDTSQSAVYLGLSATRQDMKGTGRVRHVYQQFMRDAIAWEQRTGEKLILWFTTATPSVYHAARQLFEGLEPRANRTYSAQNRHVADALRNHLGVDKGDHPFVLYGMAPQTRYSKQELDRINWISRTHNFTLFDALGIDERKGDRLLCTCKLPRR